jgi:hypothetical protein
VTQLNQHNSIDEVRELLNQQGSDSLRDARGILFNAAMHLERQGVLNAEP